MRSHEGFDADCAPVDGEVQPHQLGELGLAVAQHVGEVVGPVQVGVDGADAAAFAVQVAVDLGGDAGQLGDQVHGVLVNKLGEEKRRDRGERRGRITVHPQRFVPSKQLLPIVLIFSICT